MKTALLCLALTGAAFAGDFSLDVGVYFGVPQREVIVMRERHVPDYDMPVVLACARHARVAPSVIVNMRLGGRSWVDIAMHYGLGPEVFYMPVPAGYGPPYGKAHGYWKKRRYADVEFVDAVNVHFLSHHYGVPRADVLVYRHRGYDFVRVHRELEGRCKGRHKHRGDDRDDDDDDDDDDRHGRKSHKHHGKGKKG